LAAALASRVCFCALTADLHTLTRNRRKLLIDIPAKKTPKKAAVAKTEKSKRVSIIPQPILDAKTAALKERGVKLTWAGRKWHAGGREFTSLEMGKYGVEAFAKLFPRSDFNPMVPGGLRASGALFQPVLLCCAG
jgi:hypothetical protein